MSGTHVNREAIRDRLDRLDREYGIDYRETEAVSVAPARFPEERRLSRNGYLGSAYAWVVRRPEDAPALSESMPAGTEDADERVLMILGRGSGDAWGIPGGGREAGERFEGTVRREVREETGIDCRPVDVFGVRYERRTADGHDEVLHTLRVVFEADYEGGTIAVQPGELNGAAWLSERPRRLHPLAAPKAEAWFDDGGQSGR